MGGTDVAVGGGGATAGVLGICDGGTGVGAGGAGVTVTPAATPDDGATLAWEIAGSDADRCAPRTPVRTIPSPRPMVTATSITTPITAPLRIAYPIV